MLFIRDITILLEGYTKSARVTFLKLDRFGMFGTFGGEVHLTLYDTVANNSVTLLFRTMSSITDWLLTYKPYGFIDMRDVGYSYIVVIDEVSFKFLDCVDAVTRLPLDQNKGFGVKPEFEHLDDNMSIFVCHYGGGEEAVCTLFQAVAFFSDYISDGEAYIHGWPDWLQAYEIDTVTGSKESMYRVTFNNYRLATRLVSKVVTLNKNPLKTLIENNDW